jgi:hypothetical protein
LERETSKRLVWVTPRGAGQVRPCSMREAGGTPKFLGTGNRLSTVVRGTSSEDSIITACFLVTLPFPQACQSSRVGKEQSLEHNRIIVRIIMG